MNTHTCVVLYMCMRAQDMHMAEVSMIVHKTMYFVCNRYIIITDYHSIVSTTPLASVRHALVVRFL